MAKCRTHMRREGRRGRRIAQSETWSASCDARSMTRWAPRARFSRGIAYSISVNLTLRWVAKTGARCLHGGGRHHVRHPGRFSPLAAPHLGRRRPVTAGRNNPRSRSSRRPARCHPGVEFGAARHCDAWCASTPYLRGNTKNSKWSLPSTNSSRRSSVCASEASLIMAMQH